MIYELLIGMAAIFILMVKKNWMSKSSRNLRLDLKIDAKLSAMGLQYAYRYPKLNTDSRAQLNSIFFQHDEYRFYVPYDFNKQHSREIQNTYASLSSLMSLRMNKKSWQVIRHIEVTALAFIKRYNINAEMETVVPLILCLGFDYPSVSKALSSNIHPAVLAAVLHSGTKEELSVLIPSLEGVPIEWLASLYGFEYSSTGCVSKR